MGRLTPVLAYGTLRPGCGNDRMLGHYRHLGRTTLTGSLYYHRCGAYPVYVPDDDGLVVADVLLADEHRVDAVMVMEVNAGYDAVWRDVVLDRPYLKAGETWEVLTFPWNRPEMGPRIDSGDWTDTPHAYGVGRRTENT